MEGCRPDRPCWSSAVAAALKDPASRGAQHALAGALVAAWCVIAGAKGPAWSVAAGAAAPQYCRNN